MANSTDILEELSKRCDMPHPHQRLVESRAASSGRYPEGFRNESYALV